MNAAVIRPIKPDVGRICLYVVLTVGALGMLLPFLWMLSAAVKLDKDLFEFPIKWIPHPVQWNNFNRVLAKISFFTYFLNTLKLAVIITVLQVVTCSLAAYSFSKIQFPGRDKIFLLYLSTMMIPFQVTMIPQFIMMSNLGLGDSHASLILINAFSTFGVFLLRQFFFSIPEELSESARIDGCNEVMILTRIILPLSKAAISTLVIFTFIGAWNDYLGPLIYISSDRLKTIQLGIRFFQQAQDTENCLIMAATVMGLAPVLILYFTCQKQFVEGIATVGIKG
ncbi:ABC transporter permease [Spirochaetia bacterium]|nr:ABC transporter permease [Spirochaetia bacterium]